MIGLAGHQSVPLYAYGLWSVTTSRYTTYIERKPFFKTKGANIIVSSSSLSYYTSLILLNVADHEDTTYHIENN